MLTFNMSYFLGLFPRLSTALPFTMEVIAASILLCLCTGTLVAVIRIAKVPFLHQLCEVWLSYNRSMPFILDLYLVYFVLPVIVRAFRISPDGWPLTAYVLIALGFHYTPVISEIIRPAYLSVDRGSMRQPWFSACLLFTGWCTSSRPRPCRWPFPVWSAKPSIF